MVLIFSLLLFSEAQIITGYPFAAPIIAIVIPWLPDDASMIVIPCLSRSVCSACVIMYDAERSLMLPPGLRYSNFA